jgi:hypothetical protein
MDKQGKRQACGSGDSLFCRFRTADCTLLTLRQPSFRSSFGKANAFIPIRHAFSSHFWSVRRILHDKGRIWMEKWEGNHRIIVRIVSFCVMSRKCVSDKWGGKSGWRPGGEGNCGWSYRRKRTCEEGLDELKEKFESEGGEKTRRGAHGGEKWRDFATAEGERHTGVGGCGAWVDGTCAFHSCRRPQMGRKNAANSTRRVCCARRAAKRGSKCTKMGNFGWKTGNFEWKVARCLPLRVEKVRRKAGESRRKVRMRWRRMGDEHNLMRPNGRNAVGEQRKPGVWGKLLQCGGGATEK